MRIAVLLAIAARLAVPPSPAPAADNDEAAIREMTSEFCGAVARGDLTVLDRMFDPATSNVFYDINEGPLMGTERLKRVWQATTRNSRLHRFEFGPDMKITIDGTHALQTGTWTQVQAQQDGTTREITGRATILWKKSAGTWKAYHYHGSVTPRRPR